MKTARMMKAATARSAWWNLHLVLPVVIVAMLIGDLGVKEATGHSLYMAIVMGMTFVWIKLWMTVNMGAVARGEYGFGLAEVRSYRNGQLVESPFAAAREADEMNWKKESPVESAQGAPESPIAARSRQFADSVN